MDDKVGVFCNLQALSDFRNVKLAFFRNEEIGCLGSNAADLSFFNDCSFLIQFDRRGNSDVIMEAAGVEMCSQEFKTAIKPYMDSIKYKETIGSSTDVAALKRKGVGVCAINLSSGYHNPHTDSEIVNIKEVDSVYSAIKSFILNVGNKKFEHTYVAPKTTHYSNYRNYDDGYDDGLYSSSYSNNRNYNGYGKYKNFVQVYKHDTKLFRYIGDDSVDIVGVECPTCHNKESCIYFLPNEKSFYCTECNYFVHNPGNLFKLVEIKEKGEKFVFSWPNMGWYKLTDVEWVPALNTYLPKECVAK